MIKQKGLLFDSTLCISCGSCYTACKEENKLQQTNDDPFRDHLGAETYTVLEDHHGVVTRKLCMHCQEPTCVSVCPVGAFTKTEEGPVTYEADKCIGCRYCMQACPHTIPRYEWTKTVPRVRKCIMCSERVKAGKDTACAEICPAGATKFGDRDDLIAEALQRIKDTPDKYYPEVYGIKEGGGTNVLILSSVPFDQLGFITNLPNKPLPELTKQVLEKLPSVVSAGGVFLGGMYWLTKRKNEIAREERANSERKN